MMHGLKMKMKTLIDKEQHEHDHDHEEDHIGFNFPKLAMFQPPIEIEEDQETPKVENISINITAPQP
jgi:hypothetical protein